MPGREWGDGALRNAEHRIEDISFEGGFVVCSCEAVITNSLGNAALEQAWNVHRGFMGSALAAYAADALATDEEVAEFLLHHVRDR